MKLTIADRFLIVTHKTDKTGFNVAGVQFSMGVLGSMVLDLLQKEEIAVVENKLICKLHVASQSIHPILYAELLKSKKTRKLKTWFSRLNMKFNRFKKAQLEGLAQQRIIEIEKKKFIGLIPYSVTHLKNKPLQAEMIREIRNFILMGSEISEENKVILGIISASKSTRFLGVNRDERKEIRKKLKTLNLESAINHEMSDAIKEMQMVIIASIAATSVVTTAGAH